MISLDAAIAHFEGRPTHQVDVPEWGGTIYFKTPNSMTLSKVNRAAKGDPIEMGARLVAECAMNDKGNRVFGSLDYKELMIKADPAVLGRVVEAIMTEARLDVPAAEKN